MKETYTLVKAKNRLTIKVYPAGLSVFNSSNLGYFVFEIFPFSIAYVVLLFALSWVSIKSLYGFMVNPVMSFESILGTAYHTLFLVCFYIPAWIFIKSINTYEAVYFTEKAVTIEKKFLRFRKSSECISTNLIRQATLGLTAQTTARRGSKEFGSALTSCALVDSYRKEHRFGFWLSLYDQGIIVSEMSSFLNSLRAK